MNIDIENNDESDDNWQDPSSDFIPITELIKMKKLNDLTAGNSDTFLSLLEECKLY